ncbi:MAG: D-aminoacylase [Planctomycetes bacterium]|nr:D-aminoacylase [Planctomycetota bacterium]
MRIALLLLPLAISAPCLAQDAPPGSIDCDLLLQGGLILDGAGAEGVIGDVAIRGEKIAAVGKFQTQRAGRVIDCRGLVIAPGFIDLHSHSDRSIAEPPTRANVNYVTQGCTTVVTGNCGGGPVDVADYFRRIDSAGAGTNIIHLLPQGSLRAEVMQRENRPPTADELSRMKELAEKAMQDGAWGMSTGLIYVPSSYAETDELVEIAQVVARQGGIYASHIRGEGTALLDAVAEAISIGRQAKLPVHISHFKASGSDVWGTLRVAAELIEEARREGLAVTADQYPYIASSTSIEATLIPTWASAGGKEAMRARLRDEEDGKRIRETIAERLKLGDRIMIASYGPKPEYVGRELRQIARDEGRDVIDLVVEMQLSGSPRCVKFSMSEEDVRFAMTLPWVATASDGSAMIASADKPHPRNFGTFPRKLGHYAREERVISLAHAVRSASGLPADILSLSDRGYLRPEWQADIVVFDPQRISDRATFADPFQYSTGVRWLFVNGVAAIHDGAPTGALAGRALRRSRATAGE